VAPREDKVLELVVFGLKQGTTREQLLETVDDVSAWISSQPGFISRELVQEADGDRWIDIVWWKTLADAQAAAALAMTSETCAPMFALIDTESTLMLHGEPVIAPVYRGGDAVGI
jgi:hypothetical protein